MFLTGLVGRAASADDEAVTFSSSLEEDEASGGWKVSVSWEGPSDRVFQDCYSFGKVLGTTEEPEAMLCLRIKWSKNTCFHRKLPVVRWPGTEGAVLADPKVQPDEILHRR